MRGLEADTGALERRAGIVALLRAIVPGDSVIDALDALPLYGSDGLAADREVPLVVVLPETTAQVSAILAWCHANELKVVLRELGSMLPDDQPPLADVASPDRARSRQILEIYLAD